MKKSEIVHQEQQMRRVCTTTKFKSTVGVKMYSFSDTV